MLQEEHPDVIIHAASVTDEVTSDGKLMPGIGDVGDRLFGTGMRSHHAAAAPTNPGDYIFFVYLLCFERTLNLPSWSTLFLSSFPSFFCFINLKLSKIITLHHHGKIPAPVHPSLQQNDKSSESACIEFFAVTMYTNMHLSQLSIIKDIIGNLK